MVLVLERRPDLAKLAARKRAYRESHKDEVAARRHPGIQILKRCPLSEMGRLSHKIANERSICLACSLPSCVLNIVKDRNTASDRISQNVPFEAKPSADQRGAFVLDRSCRIDRRALH